MTDEAPLAAQLRAAMASGVRPFHMPGHKGGRGAAPLAVELLGPAAFAADVSEVGDAFDYLHRPEGPMAAAQRQAAHVFGVDRTWFLVGGATVGNLAALTATVEEADEVLLSRSSHRSVLGGLVLSGARPVYLVPPRHAGLDGFFGVSVADVASALRASPGVRAVHITSPDYYGFVAPVAEVAAVCHDAGVPLIVDEAHGTHLALHPSLASMSALAAGADAVVHSPHKTLGSLTQSALLHVQGGRIDTDRVGWWLALLQSSSPSSLLTVSLDAAVSFAGGDGWPLGAALELARSARSRVAAIDGLEVVDPARPGGPVAAVDPTKIVVDVTGVGTDGFTAGRWLRERGGLAVEFADLRRVVCTITVGDDDTSVDALVGAMSALASTRRDSSAPVAGTAVVSAWDGTLPEVVVTPRRAARSVAVAVPVAQAAGRVAAEAAIPYPPGIPLCAPGERLTQAGLEVLGRLRGAGCRIVGLDDPTGASIRCLVD